jgi:hypothetical protein
VIARIPALGLPRIAVAAGALAAQRGEARGAFAGEHLPASRQNAVDDTSTPYAKKSSLGAKRKSGRPRYHFWWEKRRHGMEAIGRRRWAIAEGYIPSESSFSDRALISHETACILNAGERDARIAITIFFANREPVGPYRVTVTARRTLHLRFNDLNDPQPIPRDTDYASVFESDVPIIVQHTRLDSRRAEVALLSTVAYAEG